MPGTATTTTTTTLQVTTTTTLPGVTVQIESFDSALDWMSSGRQSTIRSDSVNRKEGTAALVWSSIGDEDITKSFVASRDLSAAAELRIWLQANRTVGSACCGFTMRLLSGSGYFERHVLPEIPPGTWIEDVSERDSWAPSPSGTPSWNDIRGLTFAFLGDSSTTTIRRPSHGD